MRVNYHTHTTRCGHAIGGEREYVEEAIEGGIKILGFSDHAPQPFKNGYVSHIRMKLTELDSYIDTLLRIKEEYRRDIEIKIGFEAEYFPALFEEFTKIIDQYPIDYLIMGQHYLGASDENIYAGMLTADPLALDIYVKQVLEGLQTGRFSYLAHPDVMDFCGETAVYRKYMRILCRECRKMGIPLEINRLGVYEERNYPCREFFTVAAEEGNEVIIGYDAHNPATLADEASYQKCVQFAAELGIKPNEDYRI